MKKLMLLSIFAAGLSGSVADEKTAVELGKPAPDFTVTGIDGKTFKLSDKLKSGDKNVALMFSRANW